MANKTVTVTIDGKKEYALSAADIGKGFEDCQERLLRLEGRFLQGY